MNTPLLQKLTAQFDNWLVTLGFGAPPKASQARKQRIEAMYQEYAQQFPGVPEISATELMALQKTQPVVLVDVRLPHEQAVSQLPGAMTVEEFEQHRDRYQDQAIVAYCTIGHRSGLFAQKLQAEGIPAQNFRGSVLAWTHAGGEFVTPDGTPTRKVHTYGKRWDLVADGYESVWR
jgi:sodium/bile acid cotransporter 7